MDGYRITSQLGEGGMGRIYLAEDTVLHRRVAIKVLLPRTPQRSDAHARFLREAQSMATACR